MAMAHKDAHRVAYQPDYRGPFAAVNIRLPCGAEPSDCSQRTSSSASITSQILYKSGHFTRCHSQGSKVEAYFYAGSDVCSAQALYHSGWHSV